MSLAEPEFIALVDKYFSVLTLFARRWSPFAAEDVAQETFVKLLTVAKKRGVPANVPAWLFQTAKTTAIDESRKWSRRRKFRQKYESERDVWFEDSAPETRLFAQETTERLRTLEDEARQIVLLRIWGSFSFEEIAKIVGSSKSSVFREYRRALETLRDAERNSAQNPEKNGFEKDEFEGETE